MLYSPPPHYRLWHPTNEMTKMTSCQIELKIGQRCGVLPRIAHKKFQQEMCIYPYRLCVGPRLLLYNIRFWSIVRMRFSNSISGYYFKTIWKLASIDLNYHTEVVIIYSDIILLKNVFFPHVRKFLIFIVAFFWVLNSWCFCPVCDSKCCFFF